MGNEYKIVNGDAVGNRAAFARLLRASVERLSANGRAVTVLGPIPELPFHLPKVMTHALMRKETRDFSVPMSDFSQRQVTVLQTLADVDALPRVRVLYPHLRFCEGDRCRTVEEGLPLYVDDDHLSVSGIRLLSGLVHEALAAQTLRNEVVGQVEQRVN